MWRMVGKRDIGGYPSSSQMPDLRKGLVLEDGKGRDRLPRAILDRHWRREAASAFTVQGRGDWGAEVEVVCHLKLVSRAIIHTCVPGCYLPDFLHVCIKRRGPSIFFYMTSALSSVGQCLNE